MGLAVCISKLPADAAGSWVEAAATLGWLQRDLLQENEHRPMSENQEDPHWQEYWPEQNVMDDTQMCSSDMRKDMNNWGEGIT